MYHYSVTYVYHVLTIRLDSELEAVLADPRERRTVNAAARCLKASVSGPPPATSNSWRNKSMDAYVFPDPLVPESTTVEIYSPVLLGDCYKCLKICFKKLIV